MHGDRDGEIRWKVRPCGICNSTKILTLALTHSSEFLLCIINQKYANQGRSN